MVVGGSWGATLGIAYAEAYPNRVTALALRAVFLGTPQELQWAFSDGPRALRPELWAALTALLPSEEQHDPFAALAKRISDSDPAVHAPAACVWGDFERTLSEIRPPNTNPLPASLAGAAKGRTIPSTRKKSTRCFSTSLTSSSQGTVGETQRRMFFWPRSGNRMRILLITSISSGSSGSSSIRTRR